MKHTISITCCILALALFMGRTTAQETVPLQNLKPNRGQFTIVTDAMLGGVEQKNAYTIEKSKVKPNTEFTLNRQFDWFTCIIGMDDCAMTNTSTVVRIDLNGAEALKYEKVAIFEPGKLVKLSVKDAVRLTLYVEDNLLRNKRILFINPMLIKGTPLIQPPVAESAATNKPISSENITADWPYSIDPKDMEMLASALRKRVDMRPELKARIANGNVALVTFNLIRIPDQTVAKSVAENLSTALINTDFPLVERGQLDKALAELKIQDSSLIDQTTAKKLGQITGCDIILVGSISDEGQFAVINARLLETATGRAIAAERVEMRKIKR